MRQVLTDEFISNEDLEQFVDQSPTTNAGADFLPTKFDRKNPLNTRSGRAVTNTIASGGSGCPWTIIDMFQNRHKRTVAEFNHAAIKSEIERTRGAWEAWRMRYRRCVLETLLDNSDPTKYRVVYICGAQCEEYWGGPYGDYVGGFVGCDVRLLTYNSAKFLIVHGGPHLTMLLRPSKNIAQSVHACFQAASLLADTPVEESPDFKTLFESIETQVNATAVANAKEMRKLLEENGIDVAKHLREHHSTLLYQDPKVYRKFFQQGLPSETVEMALQNALLTEEWLEHVVPRLISLLKDLAPVDYKKALSCGSFWAAIAGCSDVKWEDLLPRLRQPDFKPAYGADSFWAAIAGRSDVKWEDLLPRLFEHQEFKPAYGADSFWAAIGGCSDVDWERLVNRLLEHQEFKPAYGAGSFWSAIAGRSDAEWGDLFTRLRAQEFRPAYGAGSFWAAIGGCSDVEWGDLLDRLFEHDEFEPAYRTDPFWSAIRGCSDAEWGVLLERLDSLVGRNAKYSVALGQGSFWAGIRDCSNDAAWRTVLARLRARHFTPALCRDSYWKAVFRCSPFEWVTILERLDRLLNILGLENYSLALGGNSFWVAIRRSSHEVWESVCDRLDEGVDPAEIKTDGFWAAIWQRPMTEWAQVRVREQELRVVVPEAMQERVFNLCEVQCLLKQEMDANEWSALLERLRAFVSDHQPRITSLFCRTFWTCFKYAATWTRFMTRLSFQQTGILWDSIPDRLWIVDCFYILVRDAPDEKWASVLEDLHEILNEQSIVLSDSYGGRNIDPCYLCRKTGVGSLLSFFLFCTSRVFTFHNHFFLLDNYRLCRSLGAKRTLFSF